MNKKRTILYSILVLICMICNIDRVFAVTIIENTTGVESGSVNNGCGTSCLNIGTAGMRVSLVDSTGAKVSGSYVKDYWFYDNDNSDGYGSYWYNACLGGKNDISYITSAETYLSGTPKTAVYDFCIDQSYFPPINNTLPGILTGMTNAWGGSGYSSGAKGEDNLRLLSSVDDVITKIMDKTKSKDFTWINNILSDITSGVSGGPYKIWKNSSGKAVSNFSGTYYIQVEPLAQYGSYNAYGSNNYIFYGTVAEFKKLKNAGELSSFPYLDGFSGTLGYGIHSGVFPSKYSSKSSYSFSDVYGGSGTKYPVGVSFISLKEYQIEDCASEVNGLNSVSGLSSIATKYGQSWLNNYTSYGFKNLSELKTYLNGKSNKNCPEPTCHEAASKIGRGNTAYYTMNELKKLDYSPFKYISLASYNSTSKSISNPTDSLRLVSGIPYLTNVESNKSFGVVSNIDNRCSIISCDQILADMKADYNALKNDSAYSTYRSKLNTLYNKFGAYYAFLEPSLLQTLYEDGDSNRYLLNASCKEEDPCPAPPVTAICGTYAGRNFTISDSNNSNCWENGIAYNGVSGTFNRSKAKNIRQSSIEPEYGPKGFCHEKVQFNLPNSITNGVAGKLLKWGTNTSVMEDKFGTMTVTRKCKVDASQGTFNTITSNWVNSVNPVIKLYYKEAVPSSHASSATIINNQQLSISSPTSFSIDIDYNPVASREDVSSSSRNIYCGTDCDKIRSINMVAKYDINYNEYFKWYSDKSDNFENKTENYIKTREGGVTARHYLIGYGLPTSFITPTITGTGNSKYYGYNGNGKMYITIENIGTKRGSNYHFDKILKNSGVTDDTTLSTFANQIYYSCGFQIENELFGYEDGDTPNQNVDPKGIDVVFRTIDLIDVPINEINSTSLTAAIKKAFPGRSGAGTRDMGDNWSKTLDKTDIISSKTLKLFYLILREDIYNKTPMYKIELDSPKIMQIRDWNDKARNYGDPYTAMLKDKKTDYYGFIGYGFNASGGESSFLQKLFTNGWLTTPCITYSGGVVKHQPNCNQSWWIPNNPNQNLMN